MAESKIIRQKSKWVAIWENPNPNQAFANDQTVDIDLSQYTELCFELSAIINGDVYYYVYLPAVSTVTVLSCVGGIINRRYNVSIGSTSINLGKGARIDTYGNSVDDTTRAIPIRIMAK